MHRNPLYSIASISSSIFSPWWREAACSIITFKPLLTIRDLLPELLNELAHNLVTTRQSVNTMLDLLPLWEYPHECFWDCIVKPRLIYCWGGQKLLFVYWNFRQCCSWIRNKATAVILVRDRILNLAKTTKCRAEMTVLCGYLCWGEKILSKPEAFFNISIKMVQTN